jgi:hypothetical protein
VLKWLHENGCTWDTHICNHAADNGHLEILKWIQENNLPWLKNDCMRIAKQNNDIKMIQWFGNDYNSESYIRYKDRMNVLGLEF